MDSAGRMLLVNAQLANMFGYEEDELAGVEVEELMPQARRDSHRVSREHYEAKPKLCVMASGLDLLGRRKDGSEFPIEVSLSPLRTEHELLVIGSVRDISDRRLASARLRSLLEAKKLLLKELQHRTKNNMQVISSLLGMRMQTIADPEAAAAFAKTQDQVRAMALVHDLLWRGEEGSHVDVKEYCKRLLDEIQQSHDVDPTQIRFHTRLERIELSCDTAIRLGLILNELIANSLKHAFPGGSGDIRVQIARANDHTAIEVSVSDNGIGLPEDLATRCQPTMGLQLVRGLVAQLGGTLQVQGPPGTTYNIRLASGS